MSEAFDGSKKIAHPEETVPSRRALWALLRTRQVFDGIKRYSSS
jgi:hypothetical protein